MCKRTLKETDSTKLKGLLESMNDKIVPKWLIVLDCLIEFELMREWRRKRSERR